MLTGLRRWFAHESPKTARKASLRSRLDIEALEDRRVMSVTNHGGVILPHVEVQALYYGTDWNYGSQAIYLEQYLQNLVNSSYMDALTHAGYGVGRGSFSPGKIDSSFPPYILGDAQIQTVLQSDIYSGGLQQPDANRLYVVFVQDNVVVSTSFGNSLSNSPNAFLGYHGTFPGLNAYNQPCDIHYAVVAYPGGWVDTVGNASIPWLSTVQGLTQAASQEIADAVTDPNLHYRTLGWYDDSRHGDAGDLLGARTVYLNGYAVQRIADPNDLAMTPAGATARMVEDFVLQTNGQLWKRAANNWTLLSANIASLSDQSIDNQGQAMVDVVTTGAVPYEYHEGSGWRYLPMSGAVSAKSGQGVSYVLGAVGTLWEYDDAAGQWRYLNSNVSSIDAGTDRYGVNMVDVLFNAPHPYWGGAAYEYSDTSGWHFMQNGVQSVSAGQQGISALVDVVHDTQYGYTYQWDDTTGVLTWLNSSVQRISAGTDQNGNRMFEMLTTAGDWYEYRVASGWTRIWSYLQGPIQSLSKARAGVVTVIFQHINSFSGGTVGGTSDRQALFGSVGVALDFTMTPGPGGYNWYYLTGNGQSAG